MLRRIACLLFFLSITTTTSTTTTTQHNKFTDITIVTTAALPWCTGTAINPLLRAVQLQATLVVPWLEKQEDQMQVYYGQQVFESPQAQEEWMQNWLHPQPLPNIRWYPARYHTELGSIFALGPLVEYATGQRVLGEDENNNNNTTTTTTTTRNAAFNTTTRRRRRRRRSLCILEEPEHVNWYRSAPQALWTDVFDRVVGIVHTNYYSYAVQQGEWMAALGIRWISQLLMRTYCHQVIYLSGALGKDDDFAIVQNVHGVREAFLKTNHSHNSEVYFLGKILWNKGLDHLLKLQDYHYQVTGSYLNMDVFGSIGTDEAKAIQGAYQGKQFSLLRRVLRRRRLQDVNDTKNRTLGSWRIRRRPPLPVHFRGRVDHLEVPHGIFVNPSTSEVLCTTTAEALAMGKFVIVPVHPSNDFFVPFPNCLQYRNRREFVQHVRYAQSHAPVPLTPALRHTLSWTAATERLWKVIYETPLLPPLNSVAQVHQTLSKGRTGNVLRKWLGAGPVARQYSSNNHSTVWYDELQVPEWWQDMVESLETPVSVPTWWQDVVLSLESKGQRQGNKTTTDFHLPIWWQDLLQSLEEKSTRRDNHNRTFPWKHVFESVPHEIRRNRPRWYLSLVRAVCTTVSDVTAFIL